MELNGAVEMQQIVARHHVHWVEELGILPNHTVGPRKEQTGVEFQ